ncbi:MAG: DNA replication and repair protein RecF [Chitinophagales bacterium]
MSTHFFIQNIKLNNYKNYIFNDLSFSEKLNFIVGKNGLGKTNLLDSIYYTCFTKSYVSNDALAFRFENDFFRIIAVAVKDGENQQIEIKNSKITKKEIFINSVKQEKQAEYIGKFPAVIITPDDNELITGSSENRRRFIDSTISQYSFEYLTQLMTYNKLLAQRNALLKSFAENRNFNELLLSSYTEKMIPIGNFIFEQRKQFLEIFNPVFLQTYNTIFEGNEQIQLNYESDLLHDNFENLLKQSVNSDRNAQRTTKGIHTDDLLFTLNDHPIRKIGSQGQQKTFLLSLKIAQFEIIAAKKGIKPLLLLDDIFDKLDTDRISKIFQMIYSDAFGQVFISDTNENRILQLIEKHNITQYKIISIGEIQK